MLASGVTYVVTAGAVVLWTGASCPTGFTRVTALDNRFLQANTTYNAAAGGASTHQHPSHSHGVGHDASIATGTQLSGTFDQSNAGTGLVGTSHAHGSVTVSFSATGVQVDAANNNPIYATFLICQKD